MHVHTRSRAHYHYHHGNGWNAGSLYTRTLPGKKWRLFYFLPLQLFSNTGGEFCTLAFLSLAALIVIIDLRSPAVLSGVILFEALVRFLNTATDCQKHTTPLHTTGPMLFHQPQLQQRRSCKLNYNLFHLFCPTR